MRAFAKSRRAAPGSFARLPLRPALTFKRALPSPYRIALYGTAEAARLLGRDAG